MGKHLYKIGKRKCYVCKKILDLNENNFLKTKQKLCKGFLDKCKNCSNKFFQNRYGNNLNKKAIKEKVINHYSGGKMCCNCCGIIGIDFLCVDHINNDGAKFRGKKQKFTGTIFYCWIIRNNFPKDLQILCYNCNNARHWNKGICPHFK